MPLVAPNRVSQTTTTTGTGTYTLVAAATSSRNFHDTYVTGSLVPYCVTDNTANYEIGYGTLTIGGSDTIARTTIVASSAGGSTAVTWGAGTKNIFAFEMAGAKYFTGFLADKAVDNTDWGNFNGYTGTGGNTYTLPLRSSVPLGFSTKLGHLGSGALAIALTGADSWQGPSVSRIAVNNILEFSPGSTGWVVEGIRYLQGTSSYTLGSLKSLTATSTTVTVTGAALGDLVTTSHSLSLGGLICTSYVSASNTVTVVMFNPTGSPISVAAGTLTSRVYAA